MFVPDPKPLKKEVEPSPNEHTSMKRVLDENNAHFWNIQGNQIPESPRQIYMNNTFLGMHINLPPLNPRVLRRQIHYGFHRNSPMNNFPFYHDGLKGTIQNLQSQSNSNILQRNHMHGAPNALQHGKHIQQQRTGGMHSYGASTQSEFRSMKSGNPVLNPFGNPNFRPLYMPYPLNQNMEQNSITNTTSTTFSMSKNPTVFTEEIKRQLRDGKVILLSDSVVSSNYTSDKEKEEEDKTDEAKIEKK